jgi:hypothetical protein
MRAIKKDKPGIAFLESITSLCFHGVSVNSSVNVSIRCKVVDDNPEALPLALTLTPALTLGFLCPCFQKSEIQSKFLSHKI